MTRKAKLRLAACGGAIAVVGVSFGWATAETALKDEDCSGRINPVSAAYRICR